MTEKICKKCETYQANGFYCENCGTQLYPDIGNTQWNIPNSIKLCSKPKFDRWTGHDYRGRRKHDPCFGIRRQPQGTGNEGSLKDTEEKQK